MEIKRETGRPDFRNGGITRTMADRPPTALHATYYILDLRPVAISLLDVLCCLAVILLTAYKRQAFRWTHRVNLA